MDDQEIEVGQAGLRNPALPSRWEDSQRPGHLSRHFHLFFSEHEPGHDQAFDQGYLALDRERSCLPLPSEKPSSHPCSRTKLGFRIRPGLSYRTDGHSGEKC